MEFIFFYFFIFRYWKFKSAKHRKYNSWNRSRMPINCRCIRLLIERYKQIMYTSGYNDNRLVNRGMQIFVCLLRSKRHSFLHNDLTNRALIFDCYILPVFVNRRQMCNLQYFSFHKFDFFLNNDKLNENTFRKTLVHKKRK